MISGRKCTWMQARGYANKNNHNLNIGNHLPRVTVERAK